MEMNLDGFGPVTQKVLIQDRGVEVVNNDDVIEVWVEGELETTGYYDDVAYDFVFTDGVGRTVAFDELEDVVAHYQDPDAGMRDQAVAALGGLLGDDDYENLDPFDGPA